MEQKVQDAGQEAEVTANDSLFADEVEELAELTAEAESQGDDAGDPAPEDETPPEETPPGEDDTPAEPGSGEDTPPEEMPEEPEAPEEKADKGKPPEGFVPHQALREERTKRQTLQQENDALRLELEEARKRPTGEKDPFDGFKVLNEEEFAALQEEDPDAATAYTRKEQAYYRHLDTKERESQSLQRVEYQNQAVAGRAWEEIKQIVPDIATGGEGVGKLVSFAEEQGFDSGMLTLMTNPQARISIPGEDGKMKTFPMASGAVSLVKLLSKTSAVNEADMRKKLEAEITENVTRRVTAEITGKIKNPDKPSITDSPIKPEAGVTKSFDDYTEDEWAALPAAERNKALGG